MTVTVAFSNGRANDPEVGGCRKDAQDKVSTACLIIKEAQDAAHARDVWPEMCWSWAKWGRQKPHCCGVGDLEFKKDTSGLRMTIRLGIYFIPPYDGRTHRVSGWARYGGAE